MTMNMNPTGNIETNMEEFNSQMKIDYTPDRWVVIRVYNEDTGEHLDRVLAGWIGGYLYGDSWRINSGIEKIEELEDSYLFHGYTGSVYQCFKTRYGCTGLMLHILDHFGKQEKIEVLEEYNKIQTTPVRIRSGNLKS